MALVQHAQEFTVPGIGGYVANWDVPATVTLIRAMLIGAGAGGGGSREASSILSAGGSGGGGGEMAIDVPIIVEPETTLTITLGAKGTKGLIKNHPNQTPGGPGGATIITLPNGRSFRAAGGLGGTAGTGGGDGRGGDGGGPWGGFQPPGIAEPLATDGTGGSPSGIWPWNGGPSGGSYWHAPSHAGVVQPKLGGPAPGTGWTPIGNCDGTTTPGGPGAASLFGYGGSPGDGATPNSNPSASPPPAGAWGAGGGGGGTDGTLQAPNYYVNAHYGDGAEGEDGYVLIVWMESV